MKGRLKPNSHLAEVGVEVGVRILEVVVVEVGVENIKR